MLSLNEAQEEQLAKVRVLPRLGMFVALTSH